MGYISNGKYIEITEHDNGPFDREFAQELARLFKDKTGMGFKQSRFMLLSSQMQNDMVHEANVIIQKNRRKRIEVHRQKWP